MRRAYQYSRNSACVMPGRRLNMAKTWIDILCCAVGRWLDLRVKRNVQRELYRYTPAGLIRDISLGR